MVRKIDTEIPKTIRQRQEVFLACISTRDTSAKMIIRKTARLAAYYNSKWILLYVQTPNESMEKIKLDLQRHLINNFKLATELGAEVIKLKHDDVAEAMLETIEKYNITTLCLGKPEFSWWKLFRGKALFENLLQKIENKDVDIVILS
ncbi:Sensor protein KdpD [compost metagenome]